MKRVFVSIVFFVFAATHVMCDNAVQGKCGRSSFYSETPYVCEFLCTDRGIEIECGRSSTPGCQCDFETYLNKATNTCVPIDCKNLDCVGRENQAFFTCESGSRDSCNCASFVSLDCRTGCMCKNGYCKDGDKCVKRTCKGSPFD